VFRLRDGLVAEYRSYIDASPVCSPNAVVRVPRVAEIMFTDCLIEESTPAVRGAERMDRVSSCP
jgi:hypothetical protein